MHRFELLIPPPLVALLAGLSMWGLSQFSPHWSWPDFLRHGIAGGLTCVGVMIAFSGFFAFRRAQTTISPLHPERTSHLVLSGVYRLTRNPMYLGLLLVLISVALWMQSFWALLVLPCFVLYLTRFQIIPEERHLITLFGEAYEQYCQRVRRWL